MTNVNVTVTVTVTGWIALAAALVLAPSCSCGAPPSTGGPPAVGQLSAVKVDGGFEIRLGHLDSPVRDLQVDVKLAGAKGNAVAASAGSDVVEAGIAADNSKDDFTVVVSDTRRLNLPEGAVVKVSTDKAPSSITLSHALAVDDDGKQRALTVVVP